MRVAGSPEEFQRHIATEIARWKGLVREAGLKVE